MGFGWGYGMGNYTGFPGYSFPYAGGGPGAPGVFPSAGPPEGKEGNEGEDTFEREHGEKEKESGGVTGFVKGMANGAVNLVKGMFSPQGLLMTAGTIGLTWATGGAILPLLGVIGLGTGGYQMLNGIAKGSSESAGEGFFNLGFGLLGFAGPTSVKLAGKTFDLHGGAPHEIPMKAGLLDQLKAPFGFAKYKNPETNQVMNMYQLSWNKLQENFHKLPGGLGTAGGSAMAAGSAADFHPSAPYISDVALMRQQRTHELAANQLAIEGMPTRKDPFEKIYANLQAVSRQLAHDPGNPKVIAELERLRNEATKIHQSDHAAFIKEMKRLDAKEAAVRSNWLQTRHQRDSLLQNIERDRQKAITHIVSKQDKYNQKINALIGEPLAPVTTEEQVAAGLERKVMENQANKDTLERIYNLQTLNEGESQRYNDQFKILYEQNPKHAERLQDLWNLKVLRLIEENPGNGYAKYYKNRLGENLDLNKMAEKARDTKIHELKMEILNHLNNNAMDDWQLPLAERLWLAKESTNALYQNLQKSEELKPFLPGKEQHDNMLNMLDDTKKPDPKNMPTVQAYYKFLSSLHKNELEPRNRKELVAAYLKTQPEGLLDSKESTVALQAVQKAFAKAKTEVIKAPDNAQKASLGKIESQLSQSQKEILNKFTKQTNTSEASSVQPNITETTISLEDLNKLNAMLNDVLAEKSIFSKAINFAKENIDDNTKQSLRTFQEIVQKNIQSFAELDQYEAITGKLLNNETLNATELDTLDNMIKNNPQEILQKEDKKSVLPKVAQQKRLEHLLNQDQTAFQVSGGARYLGGRLLAYTKWALESLSQPAQARENYNKSLEEALQNYNRNVFGHDIGHADSLPVRVAVANDPDKLFAPWEPATRDETAPPRQYADPAKVKWNVFTRMKSWLGFNGKNEPGPATRTDADIFVKRVS